MLTHNVITALKRMALPESYLTVRPKRLRFLIFNTAGRILHHARRVLCRIAGAAGEIGCASCPCPPAKLPRSLQLAPISSALSEAAPVLAGVAPFSP